MPIDFETMTEWCTAYLSSPLLTGEPRQFIELFLKAAVEKNGGEIAVIGLRVQRYHINEHEAKYKEVVKRCNTLFNHLGWYPFEILGWDGSGPQTLYREKTALRFAWLALSSIVWLIERKIQFAQRDYREAIHLSGELNPMPAALVAMAKDGLYDPKTDTFNL